MSYVVGSAEVELVPTAEGFDEKANALIGDLRVGVQLDADVLGLRRQVAEITDLRVGVDLGLHDTVAKAELDDLTRDRGMHIIPELSSGVVKAELDILTRPRTVEIIPVKMPEVDAPDVGGAADAAAAPGWLGKLQAAALPALITGLVLAAAPLAEVLTGAALGLGAFVAAATGGIGVLAGLTVAALAVDQSFKDALQPSLDSLKSAFDSFISANQAALLAPLQTGMQLLAQILPLLTPLLQAASGALVQLMKPIQDAVSSGAFANFIAQITPLVGPAIVAIGQIFGNLAEGLVKMMLAFAPFGQTVLNGLLGLSKAFASFTSTQAFKDFLADVVKNAPIVMTFFGQLLSVIGPLLPIMVQLGVQLIAQLGPGLTALGQILPQLIPLFVSMTPLVIDVMTQLTILANIVLQVVVPAIQFVVGIFVWFNNMISAVIDWLAQLVNGNAKATEAFSLAWRIVQDFMSGLPAFFGGLWNGLVQGVSNMVNTVTGWFQQLPGRITGAFIGAASWLWDTGSQIVSGLWRGISSAWDGFMGWIQDKINAIPAVVRQVLGIASPSRVFAEIGQFIGLGLQQGLAGSIGTAMDSATSLVGAGVAKLSTSAVASVKAQVDATNLLGSAASSDGLLQQLIVILQALLNKTATADDIARANRLLGRTGVA